MLRTKDSELELILQKGNNGKMLECLNAEMHECV
jgi:hypothetical protein